MKYVMEQQITFNEGVAHTINALVEKNEKLERENKELYKCIAVLTKEVDSIRKSIRK
jgi:cell division septum initiation protein DivIVA